MLDQEQLDAARGVLGMEKRAAPVAGAARHAASLTGLAKPVAKKGLAGLKRLLTLLGVAGGAGAGGYAVGKSDLGGMAEGIERSHALATPPSPPAEFTPQEQRQFARHGLDPERLKFLSALSDFRRGMNLDRQLGEAATRGELSTASPAMPGEELGEYA